jgi:hypothetical protein
MRAEGAAEAHEGDVGAGARDEADADRCVAAARRP